jgi:signal transduction histidine kinase
MVKNGQKRCGTEVKLNKKDGRVMVRVMDSGKGISKAERSRLFKKFVRLDNSLKRASGGAGLGLYIAKALAERNGGELKLEESTTRGSVFCLALPLLD